MIDPSLLQGKKGTDHSDQNKETQKAESKRVADGQLPPSPFREVRTNCLPGISIVMTLWSGSSHEGHQNPRSRVFTESSSPRHR